jgi:hypothetical protein
MARPCTGFSCVVEDIDTLATARKLKQHECMSSYVIWAGTQLIELGAPSYDDRYLKGKIID